MRAAIGDTLHIHTNHLGTTEHLGEILEVRGLDGAPPYLVQFRDGTTRLLYPGPDAVVEHPTAAAHPAPVHAPLSPAVPSHSPAVSSPQQVAVSARRIHTRPGW
ncbi:DUF1918 domain-containing protein [Actinospica durhamensis]|uniref:DUF1918 domain-containing protein n=1 Tax=Actinospica durhamensis TaxID=1508375 RepID=A0A941ENF1_9ACTN|nr:DUF1918 domain-containing protein [Actinospica durhamensis]MBR7834143.1 DUF1918 domain-containing protein [Actinospica durhamensis]